MMREENAVAKVKELMETLDHVKKYNALTRSLRGFLLIVGGSGTLFLVLGMLLDFLGLRPTVGAPLFLLVDFLVLLIPVSGITAGILYVRKNVNSIETGVWKKELSHGFPSALKMLSELDWDKTLDEIAMGKLSYALYGFLKTGAYWFVTSFGLSLLWNAFTLFALHAVKPFSGFIWALFSLLIVLLVLSKDLVRRYKEIHALDMLLLELRWFSFEFRRAEFQA